MQTRQDTLQPYGTVLEHQPLKAASFPLRALSSAGIILCGHFLGFQLYALIVD
jgi:hypothetical protein